MNLVTKLEFYNKWDPRYFQILAQLLFILLGVYIFEFNLDLFEIIISLASALISQYLFCKVFKVPLTYKSAVITSLSISLLLRSNYLWAYAMASFIAIASKFLIRFKKKHIFNPANFGIVVMITLSNYCWLSPGQWGAFAWLALVFICFGMIVTNRSARADISLAFVTMYILLLVIRGWWLHEPFSLTLYQIQNGAVLIFAFFTISDPKTTPNSKPGRIIFGFICATMSLILKFSFFVSYDLVYALFVLSPFVPLINFLLPGKRFVWEERVLAWRKNKNEDKIQSNY